jgi:hypothetical protein
VLRVRLVAIGFLVLLVGGLLLLPAVLTYTFVAGDTATARVTACRQTKRLSCSGRWQDADGRTRSGHISGVDRDDVGRSVEVRIGPLGPYAGGFGRSWGAFTTLLPFLVGPPIWVVLARRLLNPGRAVARRLLATAPQDGPLLSVTADEATWTDGRPYASLRDTDAPMGHLPMELPGRQPRQSPGTVFTAAAGLHRTAAEYALASGPAAEPLFVIERRSFADFEPETWLLDFGGTTLAVVRRTQRYPTAFELLDRDGNRFGTMRLPDGVRSGAYEARGADGGRAAVMAAYGRRWVLRVEPGATPVFRDLMLAFVFDAARLHM